MTKRKRSSNVKQAFQEDIIKKQDTNVQQKIELLDKKIQTVESVIKNQQEKMEYLYEREKQRENFEKADRKFFNTYLIEALAQITFFALVTPLGVYGAYVCSRIEMNAESNRLIKYALLISMCILVVMVVIFSLYGASYILRNLWHGLWGEINIKFAENRILKRVLGFKNMICENKVANSLKKYVDRIFGWSLIVSMLTMMGCIVINEKNMSINLIRFGLFFFDIIVIMLLTELSDRIRNGERGLAFNVITLFIAIASLLISVQDKLAYFIQQL